jgi:FMN phosphatase YigB (HAD superfamily)
MSTANTSVKPKVRTTVGVKEFNSSNTILTDVDGVLLSWGAAFNDFMLDNGYTQRENMEHHYRLSLQYHDVTDKEVNELVEKFNTSDAIKYLQPWKDAVKYVKRLQTEGYNFVCITALSEHPHARLYRQYNLDFVFGEGVFHHEHMICLPVGASKHSALSTWAGSDFWWIEDHFRHAESGYELGLRSVLMDNPHNKHFNTDLFPRVESWEEIYMMVREDRYELL